MAFGLPIRWRRITRGSAASRDVFLIPKLSYIIRHCKFVSQGACIFSNSKRQVLFKLEKKTRRRKNLSLNRVFHKLDNNKWKMHTGARARKQKNIYLSIYLSIWKPLYIYIYISTIYIYICANGPKSRIFAPYKLENLTSQGQGKENKRESEEVNRKKGGKRKRNQWLHSFLHWLLWK